MEGNLNIYLDIRENKHRIFFSIPIQEPLPLSPEFFLLNPLVYEGYVNLM